LEKNSEEIEHNKLKKPFFKKQVLKYYFESIQIFCKSTFSTIDKIAALYCACALVPHSFCYNLIPFIHKTRRGGDTML